MAETPNNYIHEEKLIFTIIKILGMAPYTMGTCVLDTHLSKWLVVYNILLAILIVGNTWYSENDESNNDVEYSNKTVVVDVAYDMVDYLANIYVSTCIVLSIGRHKKSSSLYFETIRLDHRYEGMGVVFDKKKASTYFIAKMSVMMILSLAVIASYIYFEVSAKYHYTITYWICVTHPKIVATIVTMVFGSCALNIYSKLWVINEFLRTMMEEYVLIAKHKKLIQSLQPNISYEKTLEKIILAHQITSSKSGFFFKSNKISPVAVAKRKLKPFNVFIKNFPECFERDQRNVGDELMVLREVHFEVLEYGALANELFGRHFLFLFVLLFLGVVINVYASVEFFVSGTIHNEFGSCMIWNLAFMTLVLYLISFANLACGEAKETIATIHKFLTKINQDDHVLKRELQSFVMQMVHNPMEFTASNCFIINSSLLFSFVVGVISNVIFIIQFDQLNLRSSQETPVEKPTAKE